MITKAVTRKALENPAEKFIVWLGRSQFCNVDKNKLVHGFFSIILWETFHSCSQNSYLQNIGWMLPCAISNITIENFAILQRGSIWFLFM